MENLEEGLEEHQLGPRDSESNSSRDCKNLGERRRRSSSVSDKIFRLREVDQLL
jgi:hypothetical protein